MDKRSVEKLRDLPVFYTPRDCYSLVNKTEVDFTHALAAPVETEKIYKVDRDTVLLCVLAARVSVLVLLTWLLSIHGRSVRVFRWEHTVSGGILVTYCVAEGALVLCAGAGFESCGGFTLQVYLISLGCFLFAVNSIALLVLWRRADEMTHAMMELLSSLGWRLRRQIHIKYVVSMIVAVIMLVDLVLTWVIVRHRQRE